MRPQVSEDNVERIEDAINDELRIPADRLSFNEQIELLVDLYQEEQDTTPQQNDDLLQGSVKRQSSGTIRR